MDDKIALMYAEKKRSYLGRYGLDVVKTAAIIIVVLVSMISSSYKALMKQARSNWDSDRCNPIYLPFAGKIMPRIGKTEIQITSENFNFCVHKNVSEVLTILLMPLEFINFLILTSLDLLIQGMLLAMKLFNYIAGLLKSFGTDINNKLGAILIPLTITITKMRDALARSSSVVLTSLYIVLSVYNIMTAGLISIANIVLDILIVISGTIAAMLAVGTILYAFFFTAPAGIAIIATALLMLLVLFLPTLIIWILLSDFMVDVFGARANPSPF
jgi:hypothetical protein